MELSREEEMQAYTTALAAIATAAAWQLDAIRFTADLRALARHSERAGDLPAAGLIETLAVELEARTLVRRKEH